MHWINYNTAGRIKVGKTEKLGPPYSKPACHAAEEGPEPCESFRVSYLSRVRNIAKRRKPGDCNTEAYCREDCRKNHSHLY